VGVPVDVRVGVLVGVPVGVVVATDENDWVEDDVPV